MSKSLSTTIQYYSIQNDAIREIKLFMTDLCEEIVQKETQGILMPGEIDEEIGVVFLNLNDLYDSEGNSDVEATTISNEEDPSGTENEMEEALEKKGRESRSMADGARSLEVFGYTLGVYIWAPQKEPVISAYVNVSLASEMPGRSEQHAVWTEIRRLQRALGGNLNLHRSDWDFDELELLRIPLTEQISISDTAEWLIDLAGKISAVRKRS